MFLSLKPHRKAGNDWGFSPAVLLFTSVRSDRGQLVSEGYGLFAVPLETRGMRSA